MNDLDLNKNDLLEAAKALQAAVKEVSQYNAQQLDLSEAQRAALRQFMRDKEELIQDMKYQFEQDVARLRQDFCKQSAPPAASCAPADARPAPLDSPASPD